MNNKIQAEERATISICETYRGVGVHVFQTPTRISKVKRAIDDVYAIGALDKLYAYCDHDRNPPEARLFAAAKLEAIFESAVDNREARPNIDLLKLRAIVGALNSLKWVSKWKYGSVLSRHEDLEPRERTLTDAEIGR